MNFSQISTKQLIRLLIILQVTRHIFKNNLFAKFFSENLLIHSSLTILPLFQINDLHFLCLTSSFYHLPDLQTMLLLQIYHRSFLNLFDIRLITFHHFRRLKQPKNQIISSLDLELNSSINLLLFELYQDL